MKKFNITILAGFALMVLQVTCYAQDDLMSQLETQPEKLPVTATFKSPRVINGHSVETRTSGQLDFIINHRFGRLNSGIQNFFGLDEAWIRLGLEYAVTDHFTLGVGRSSFKKTYDGFLKYKVFSQMQGGGSPVSVTALVSSAIDTQKPAGGLDLDTQHKMAYVAELLIARKITPGLSLQLMPTWIHRNLVASSQEENDIYAIGIAGRQKITSRTSLTFEYYHQLNNETPALNHNAIGIGVDIETGGHVFQLHLTNSRALVEKEFITNTTGDFFGGDIHFGFNVVRAFQLKRGW